MIELSRLFEFYASETPDSFDEVMVGLTNGKDTAAMYLDYAIAIDKVDHRLLLRKLYKYGFSFLIGLFHKFHTFFPDHFYAIFLSLICF